MSETTTEAPVNAGNPAPSQAPAQVNGPIDGAVVPETVANSATWKDALPPEIRDSPSISHFKGVEDLAKSYLHAQKMIGGDKVVVPGKDATPDDWGRVYDRLGRPENADGYEIPENLLPEGVEFDPALTKQYLQKFHESGLSTKQAQQILAAHGEVVKGLLDQQSLDAKIARDDGEKELRKDWGRQYETNMELARRAIRDFGDSGLESRFTQDVLMSDPAVTKLLAKVGEHLRGDIGVGVGSSQPSAMTPQSAMEEINRLMLDKDFMSARSNQASPGHLAAKEKWRKLHEYAYPD